MNNVKKTYAWYSFLKIKIESYNMWSFGCLKLVLWQNHQEGLWESIFPKFLHDN